MNTLTHLAIRLYALLLHLYPHPFYVEFGDEMRAVFAAALANAARRGPWAGLVLCAREFGELPWHLLREHGLCLQAALARMHAPHPAPWQQIGLAILPGLVIVAGYWLSSPWAAWTIWLWFGVLLVGTVDSIRKRRLTPALWPTMGFWTSWLFLVGRFFVYSESFGDKHPSGPAIPILPLISHLLIVLPATGCLVWLYSKRNEPENRHLLRRIWAILGIIVALAGVKTALSLAIGDNLGPNPATYVLSLFLGSLLSIEIMLAWLGVGLPLARGRGMAAIVVVLAGMPFAISMLLDPTYKVTGSPLLSWRVMAAALNSIQYGALLVVAPLAVLRARSARGQVLGALLPVLCASLCAWLLPGLSGYRQRIVYWHELLTLGQFALGVVLALIVYGAVWRESADHSVQLTGNASEEIEVQSP